MSPDDDVPWTEECASCGREFETTDWHRSLCGPCRRAKWAAHTPIKTTPLHAVQGRSGEVWPDEKGTPDGE